MSKLLSLSDQATQMFWRIYTPVALLLGVGVFIGLCLLWLPFAVLLNGLLPQALRHWAGRLAIRCGLRFYLGFLRLFCGCRIRFELDAATLAELKQGSSILVANHPSLLDAVLFLAHVPNTVCVMKAALLDNPLLGAAARLAGFIRNADAFDLLANSKELLDEKAHLLIFPEGTRTAAGSLLNPLTPSAALLASKLNVPLRSFLIHYDQPFLGKADAIFALPRLPMTITLRSGRVFAARADYAALTTDLEAYWHDTL